MTTALEIEEGLLDAFIGDGSITEVLYIVRSGKEATVYCCRGSAAVNHALVAAKLYRPLERRNFHNDSIYQTGRDAAYASRDRRALARKSSFGRSVQYGTWIDAEYQTMRELFQAGADIPQVYARSSGALLMEYFGDEDGAAPMLSRVELTREQAGAYLRKIIDNVTLCLRSHKVHADLSAYNILLWRDRTVMIDFPQAVDARLNPNARQLLHRDVVNLCDHFRRYGIRADGGRIADEMWRRYRSAEL